VRGVFPSPPPLSNTGFEEALGLVVGERFHRERMGSHCSVVQEWEILLYL